MADDPEPEKIWDEYDWERFLQQQDRKTERYMDLLARYIDDPNRDQIIAREMGWYHLLDEDGKNWAETVDSDFSEEMELIGGDDEAGEEPDEREADSFELHPLYQASFGLKIWLDHLFEQLSDLQNHPAAVRLVIQSEVASAKLAAALSDDDVDELGMSIAYLKRALRAITNAMEAAAQLHDERHLDYERYGALKQRLFQIRDGIITRMGEFRMEWRRRYGFN